MCHDRSILTNQIIDSYCKRIIFIVDQEEIKKSRMYQYLTKGATKATFAINYHYLPRDTEQPLCEICMAAVFNEHPYHDRITEHLILFGIHSTSLRCSRCNKPLITGEPAIKCTICCLEINRFLNSLTEENFRLFLESDNRQLITIEASRKLKIPREAFNTYNASKRFT